MTALTKSWLLPGCHHHVFWKWTQTASHALFAGSIVLLPATEKVLVEQLDWSEDKNINPYAVFEKPPASVEVTPNIGRRGQTGIAVTGSNFTPSAQHITIRCDGQIVASDVHADSAGRVVSSFVIPESASNGSRIVEVTDGVYSAQTNLQINDPLVVTRVERIEVTTTIIQKQTIIVPTDYSLSGIQDSLELAV